MAIPPTPGDPRLSLRPAPSGGEHDAPSPRLGGQGVACLWCGLTSSGGGSVSVLCMSPREQNAPMPHWQGLRSPHRPLMATQHDVGVLERPFPPVLWGFGLVHRELGWPMP